MTNNNVNGLPIQFDAPSVNAILKNKKTQTRRVVDELVNRENDVMLVSPSLDGGFRVWFKDQQYIDISSPFGNRGDKLWIQEPFTILGHDKITGEDYLADKLVDENQLRPQDIDDEFEVVYCANALTNNDDLEFRPAGDMPYWMSRVVLMIETINLKKLHQMDVCDYIAEGYADDNIKLLEAKDLEMCESQFKDTWNHYQRNCDNASYAWDNNPFVWVVNFKVVQVKNTI